jgi:hypothetical protein
MYVKIIKEEKEEREQIKNEQEKIKVENLGNKEYLRIIT